MGKINLLFPQKVRIFFLFLPFIINAIMFFLPYIPGAFPNVVKESPDAIIPDISFQYSFF